MKDSYFADNCDENHASVKCPMTVHVYGDVVVKEFDNHIRIAKNDWLKYNQRLIPVLKQGDRKDATRDNQE